MNLSKTEEDPPSFCTAISIPISCSHSILSSLPPSLSLSFFTQVMKYTAFHADQFRRDVDNAMQSVQQILETNRMPCLAHEIDRKSVV